MTRSRYSNGTTVPILSLLLGSTIILTNESSTDAFLLPNARLHNPSIASFHQPTPFIPLEHRSISSPTKLYGADDFKEMAYTESAWACISSLTNAADYYGSTTVDPPLLLDTILNPTKHGGGEEAESAKNVAEKVLGKAGVDAKKMRSGLEAWFGKRPKVSGWEGTKTMGQGMVQVLEKARTDMPLLGDSFVATEALLLGLFFADTSFTIPFLASQNLAYDKMLEAVMAVREKTGPATTRSAENLYDALNKYGIDFTQQASEGKLDPVIGRDDEIRRAIQILSRRTKNNPVLIGDPGVGKTAIAEGIAQRMITGDVPDTLKPPCKLIGLDMGALVAGATMRGEFEERLKGVVDEVKASDGEVILFMDEMHTLVGAGAAQGSMDASNLLKPALARGTLRCIGATTTKEYRQYIEKDKALERRFQQVMIEEPSPEDTVSILRGLKPRYELHHGVRIRDEALLAAASLSHRYIPDRFLPDKAIDLVDEACAKLKNELTTKPTALDEIDRRIIQLEMERLSLQSDANDDWDDWEENNPKPKPSSTVTKRLMKLDDELAELKRESESFNVQWEAEKGGVDAIQILKEKIAQVTLDIERAEREYDLSTAAELKFSELPPLEEELEKALAVAEMEDDGEDDEMEGTKMLRDEVIADDIADIIAVWTGIPPQKMLESDRDRILRIGDVLRERVIGQNAAIEVVTEAIQRSRAGLNDPTKPIASLIFLGPTGVGKTELCKALADFMFDTEDAIIRMDMSEYMEKHTVSRLVGAPPGYVGYDEGGQLTDAVRRKPYSVILFDEMEKAHPDVFNIMLQMLDDGRVTDSKGNTVNFRNTVIIYTSNVGSQDILDLEGSSDPDSQKTMKERVTAAMREKFKPEFLNRIDENVIFNSLSKKDLRGIVRLEVQRLEQRLADRSISLVIKDEALDLLTDLGFDPVYGARPLKRTIQRQLETTVAKSILSGDFDDGDTVLVDTNIGDDGENAIRVSKMDVVDAPVVEEKRPPVVEKKRPRVVKEKVAAVVEENSAPVVEDYSAPVVEDKRPKRPNVGKKKGSSFDPDPNSSKGAAFDEW